LSSSTVLSSGMVVWPSWRGEGGPARDLPPDYTATVSEGAEPGSHPVVLLNSAQ
jgi:hypothetical protein